jgi:hypothetical protein
MNARFTSKADIEARQTDICFVPIADIPRCPRYVRFIPESSETDRTTPIQAA